MAQAIFFGMLVVFAICIAFAVSWVDFRNTAATINLFLSAVTAAFTILLYFFCINGVAWSRRERLLFENMVIIFFLTVLSLMLASGSTGNSKMFRITALLNTLLYLLSSIYWIVFWLFQKGKYSHPLGEKVYGIIYNVFWGIYILLVILNHAWIQVFIQTTLPTCVSTQSV